MTPFDAIRTAEQDQKWDGEPVYWFVEQYDGQLYFVLQDGIELHEWLMEYQGTTTVPADEEL